MNLDIKIIIIIELISIMLIFIGIVFLKYKNKNIKNDILGVLFILCSLLITSIYIIYNSNSFMIATLGSIIIVLLIAKFLNKFISYLKEYKKTPL
jgi:drug/metabolite transporter (DMT)-like permease